MNTSNRMNLLTAAAAIFPLIIISSPAFADPYKSGPDIYAGVYYNFASIDDGFDRLSVETMSAKIGAQPHPYFGIEGRIGFSTDDHHLRGVDYSLDNTLGAYAVLHLANQSPVTPYFLFGASHVEIIATSSAGTTTEEDSDFSFGAGLDIEIAPGLSGNIEYLQYYDNGTTIIDGMGLGATIRF
ncbi:outer membrane beta-barrel protein [Marinobacter sp. CHS3-4]|uniref:outer membrane beta-barrel protein n=1 Tax=Marinobacter sp. CHS3-4 TaxID=3045174 RepID=UPI0024B4B33E|nr:outer membrane beta-barrel protein [Marinobacter sp. CHS3-4]MDI9245397.1 porin family protein [Marinobacter sp. CHS3-4]